MCIRTPGQGVNFAFTTFKYQEIQNVFTRASLFIADHLSSEFPSQLVPNMHLLR